MKKYVKNGVVTAQGKAFQNGVCWGLFFAGLIVVLSRTV